MPMVLCAFCEFELFGYSENLLVGVCVIFRRKPCFPLFVLRPHPPTHTHIRTEIYAHIRRNYVTNPTIPLCRREDFSFNAFTIGIYNNATVAAPCCLPLAHPWSPDALKQSISAHVCGHGGRNNCATRALAYIITRFCLIEH